MLVLRPETPDDHDAIRRVTAQAFAGKAYSDGTEADIPDLLRDAGALVFSHVAEQNGEVIGHVALSPVGVGLDWDGYYALGPISVVPAHQRQGVGRALMGAAIEFAKLNSQGIILEGDPRYYSQFGFVLMSETSKHLQMLTFGDTPKGEVTWHAAFGVG